MRQQVIKIIATTALILIRAGAVVFSVYLTLGLFVVVDASPYSIHAWLIGIPSVMLIERAYTNFWNKRWGNKSNQKLTTVTSK